MKIILMLLLLFNLTLSHAQTDFTTHVEIPNARNEVYIYDSVLQIQYLHYQYFNHCDLDGDDIQDSITFIGWVSPHPYFHLVITLSSNGIKIDSLPFLIDVPSLKKDDSITESTQFFIKDFDGDGKDEIYIKSENIFLPPGKDSELRFEKVIIDFENGKLRIVKYDSLKNKKALVANHGKVQLSEKSLIEDLTALFIRFDNEFIEKELGARKIKIKSNDSILFQFEAISIASALGLNETIIELPSGELDTLKLSLEIQEVNYPNASDSSMFNALSKGYIFTNNELVTKIIPDIKNNRIYIFSMTNIWAEDFRSYYLKRIKNTINSID